MTKFVRKLALNLHHLVKYHCTHKTLLLDNLASWEREFRKLLIETADFELIEAKESALEAIHFYYGELTKYRYI